MNEVENLKEISIFTIQINLKELVISWSCIELANTIYSSRI